MRRTDRCRSRPSPFQRDVGGLFTFDGGLGKREPQGGTLEVGGPRSTVSPLLPLPLIPNPTPNAASGLPPPLIHTHPPLPSPGCPTTRTRTTPRAMTRRFYDSVEFNTTRRNLRQRSWVQTPTPALHAHPSLPSPGQPNPNDNAKELDKAIQRQGEDFDTGERA